MIVDTNYWSKRSDLDYYRTACDFARRAAGYRLLDVGGGVGMGCRYLTWLPDFERTSVELPSRDSLRLPDVRVIESDFLKWKPDGRYDVVLCLQCIEHIPDAHTFTQKLFTVAPLVVISVPHMWPAGKCKWHVHDPIDEHKLRAWTGRDPDELVISDRRLIAMYQQGL